MTTDLKANFKERHCKHLHETIKVVASLAKRTCPEGVQEEPMKDAPPMPVPPLDAAGSSSMPIARKETCPAQDETLSGPTPIEEDLDQKDVSASFPPPSWEEMMEMLRRVPCFTDVEPHSTKMSDFFPLTKRISMNLGGDPPRFRHNQAPIRHLRVCCFSHLATVGLHGSGDCKSGNLFYFPHFMIM